MNNIQWTQLHVDLEQSHLLAQQVEGVCEDYEFYITEEIDPIGDNPFIVDVFDIRGNGRMVYLQAGRFETFAEAKEWCEEYKD